MRASKLTILQIICFTCFGLPVLHAQNVSTIAGILASVGKFDTLALSSSFNNPHGVEVDRQGNVYIADRFNHVIRKLNRQTGKVSTLAGSGKAGSADGQGTNASFREPWGLTVDSLGNVFVADTKNNKIRKISPAGMVSTIAGSGSFGITDAINPLAASFGNPTGIAVDNKGNLFVGDHLTHLIRKINASGAVSTLAGNRNYPNNAGFTDGIGQAAKFNRPYGIELDKNGNVYVADEWNHAIRKISPIGVVSTMAGNGSMGMKDDTGKLAQFNFPWDVAIDSAGSVYVADGYNYLIRKIDFKNVVTTFAGTNLTSGAKDGEALNATFNGATSISLDSKNKYLVVGDAYNQLIRQIDFKLPLANPKISFSTSPTIDSISICENQLVEVHIDGDFDSYNIFLNNNIIMSTFNKSFTIGNLPLGLSTINVVGVKNGYSDMNSNFLKINSRANIAIKFSSNTTSKLCEGDSAKISTIDQTIIKWNTSKKDSSIWVHKSGAYFSLIDSSSCIFYSDTVKLAFNTIPKVNVSQSGKNPYLVGDQAILTASGGEIYYWSNQIESNENVISTSGKYAVKVTNAFGCSAISDSIELIFNPKPEELFIISEAGNSFCEGSSLRLSANVSKNIAWRKDGQLIGFTDSSISITSPGSYTFDYKKNALTETSTAFVVIKLPKPMVDFVADKTLISSKNGAVQFTSLANSAVKYEWDFGDGTSTYTVQESNLIHEYLEPGSYTVSHTVTDLNGCQSKISKEDYIQYESLIFIPTGFTPNGDGINDEVRVRGINSGEAIQFMIFNEWGELVFNTNNANIGWDGTYKGQKANAGNYSYILLVNHEDKQDMLKGIITLIQ